MATRWRAMNGLVVALGLGGMGASIAPRDCPAQEVPGPRSLPAVHPLDLAVGATLKDGWPTVVVITSTASPESGRLLQSLQQAPQARELSRAGQIVSLGLEANATRMRRMGVTSAPMILVYGRGTKGLELAGVMREPKGTESALAWLEALGAVPASSAVSDTAVVRTDHQHNASPRPRRRRPRPSSIRRLRRLSRPLHLRQPPGHAGAGHECPSASAGGGLGPLDAGRLPAAGDDDRGRAAAPAQYRFCQCTAVAPEYHDDGAE